MSAPSPFAVLIDRIADTELAIEHVQRVRRTARSLIEAQTQLDSVAWLLQQQWLDLKRQLDALIDEAKAAKAKSSKKDK